MEARLTPLKVERVRESFREMKVKTQTTLRKLQSLIGLLNFACSVVVPGRAFLRRLIDLTCGVSKPHELIELTEENKARHWHLAKFYQWIQMKICISAPKMVVVRSPHFVFWRLGLSRVCSHLGFWLVWFTLVLWIETIPKSHKGIIPHCYYNGDMGKRITKQKHSLHVG